MLNLIAPLLLVSTYDNIEYLFGGVIKHGDVGNYSN